IRAVDTGKHVIGVCPKPSDEHKDAVNDDEEDKPAKAQKVDRPGNLAVQHPAQPSQPVGESRPLQQPHYDLNRGGDEEGEEIGELLEAVETRRRLHGREVQRRVLDCRRQRVRKDLPGEWDETLPLVGQEQVAIALGQAGADVVVNYVAGEDRAQEVVRAIEQHGVKAYAHLADVSNETQVRDMFSTMTQRLGTIDILVNNAGPERGAPLP